MKKNTQEKNFLQNDNDNNLTQQTKHEEFLDENEKKQERKNKIIKLLIVAVFLALFSLAIYLPLKLTGALDKITSVEALKNLIHQTGVWGYLTFFVIQFLQVTFIPIPAAVTTIAGTLVFPNPWIVLFISIFSVLLASVFAFWIGRKFGKKVVYWIVGKQTAQKYNEKLKRGKYVFFLMMLFPGFPDDILCMLAGMTSMSFKFFLATNLITRPIVFVGLVFFGSGLLIPFSGWGIYAWIAIGILMITAFYISFKKQPDIEEFLFKIANKLKRKESQLKDKKIDSD